MARCLPPTWAIWRSRLACNSISIQAVARLTLRRSALQFTTVDSQAALAADYEQLQLQTEALRSEHNDLQAVQWIWPNTNRIAPSSDPLKDA